MYADTWLFYSWTELIIKAVTWDMYEWVKEVLSWQLERITEEEQTVVAFDISFIYSWEEVQPLTWTVQVSFNYENNEDLKAAEEDEEQEVKVYHLNDKDEEWEKIEEITWAKVEEVMLNEEKSDEENMLVVEAENFSIYAIIKSTTSNQTIIYDANWWFFGDWSATLSITYDRYVSNQIYWSTTSVQAPNRDSEDITQQSWWMFAWWYLEPWNANAQTTEWLAQDTSNLPEIVYAKWLPFNDLEVDIWWNSFIVMDRNLWASAYMNQNGKTSNDWFGKLYQRWNNYGFPVHWQVQVSSTKIDWSKFWPWNYYYSSIFIYGSFPYYWTTNNQENLWWGWKINNWDNLRQWPCPSGYHVPDYLEWKAIKSLVESNMSSIYWCSSVSKCISSKLLMPFPWIIDSNGVNWNENGVWIYWSSSPKFDDSNYYSYSLLIYNNDGYKYWSDNTTRSVWWSVRCLKNTNGRELTLDPRNWKENTTFNIRRREPVTEALKPVNPINGNAWFKWRYDEDWNKFIFSDSTFINWHKVLHAEYEQNTSYVFDANGWEFLDWTKEKTIEIENVEWRYFPIWSIPGLKKEKDSYTWIDWKIHYTWWMFDWWYTTSWDWKWFNQQEEWTWQSDWIIVSSKRVYARWLPFEDMEIKIWDIWFTIMDRNLWAKSVAEWTYFWSNSSEHEDYDKLWNYYQWWNNYGFKGEGNLMYSVTNSNVNNRINWDEYWPNNYYYWTIFSSIKTSPYRWTINDNKNLWWGNNKNSIDAYKQWPCPLWYHVPDSSEWSVVYKLFTLEKNSLCSQFWIDVWSCFAYWLKLPFAGMRASTTISSLGKNSYYWSSTPGSNGYNAYALNVKGYVWAGFWDGSVESQWTSSRDSAYSLRCFKNSSDNHLIFKMNNWEDDFVLTWGRRWEPITSALKPNDPKRYGSNFLWWYDWEEKFIFSWYIDSPKILQARYVCKNWYIERENGECEAINPKIISFDTDWWSEKPSVIVPWWMPERTINAKFSHTPNIDDDWNQKWNYANNYTKNEVVTIPWAANLHVKIIYWWESNSYDWVSMWAWNHPDYTANGNHSTSLIWKLWWWSHTSLDNIKEYDVVWDTVTFAFRSDWSGVGDWYWYYAIIMDKEKYIAWIDYIQINFSLWENPLKDWYAFAWWYKENWEMWNIENDVVNSDITLYAHWRDKEAILLPWKDLNCKLKSLANNRTYNSCYSNTDYRISKIVRANSIPEWEKVIEIQDISSEYYIYAWFDKGTIYIYSEADAIYMNPDSSSMFYYMQNLKNFEADNFDVSKVINMWSMFSYCSALNYLDLSSWKTTSLVDTNSMFRSSQSLKTLNLSWWDTRNVLDMSSMFDGVTSLETLILDWWDFTNHPNVSSMFNSLYSLKMLSLKNWIIPEILWNWQNNNWGFYNGFGLSNSNSLETIDVSNWNLSRTKSLYQLFYNLYFVKSIIWLETWDTINVENLSRLFGDCYNLENLDISTWNTSSVTNISELFYNCKSIEELDLSRWDTSNVTNMVYMFEYCDSLEKLNLDNWDFSKVWSNYASMFYSTPSLVELGMKNWKFWNNVENFACNMALWCHWWSPVYNKVKEIDVSWWMFSWNTLRWLFYDWESLESIKWFETWDTSSIENMSKIFYNAKNLGSVDLGWRNTSNVKYMESMFEKATGLSEIDLWGWNISKVENMDNMFNETSNLKTVYVWDDFKVQNFSSAKNMFSGAISIVGWNGTTYNSQKKNQEYAKIDSITASWYLTNILDKPYVITYDLDWWIITWEKTVYTQRDSEYILPEPSKQWYKFIWWTWSNWNVPEEVVSLAWRSWDLIFTANWNPEDFILTVNHFKMGLNWIYQSLPSNMNNYIVKINDTINSWDIKLMKRNYSWFTLTWIVQDIHINPDWTISPYGTLQVNYYYIRNSYHLIIKDGANILIDKDVLFEDKITLPDVPEKKNYLFAWWENLPKDGKMPDADLVIVAKWMSNSSTWWGGWAWSSIDKKVIEDKTKNQEHKAAEEKQEVKQKTEQEEQTKVETEIPEKMATTNQTSTQQSSSSSKDNTVIVDPEILTAYEWAYKHDVTTLPTIHEAMPDGVVKRWHLAKMVVNYATNILWREIPEKIPSECRWNDNRKDRESDEIKDYAVKSCALWLMWLDMPKFLPNMEVTRAQFGTIMSRLLWWKKYAWWTPYYRKHLNALKENNIMTQIENPEKRVELRQWVWLMLMRSAENK